MKRIAEAILSDGTKLPYVIIDNPPSGSMKHTFFTPDKKFAVQFFNNDDEANNPNLQRRMNYIIGKYNPTLSEKNGGANGNTEESANYFYNPLA